MRKAMIKREIRMSRTLFLVSFCYFLFVLPIAMVNIMDTEKEKASLQLALFCLYWLQYRN